MKEINAWAYLNGAKAVANELNVLYSMLFFAVMKAIQNNFCLHCRWRSIPVEKTSMLWWTVIICLIVTHSTVFVSNSHVQDVTSCFAYDDTNTRFGIVTMFMEPLAPISINNDRNSWNSLVISILWNGYGFLQQIWLILGDDSTTILRFVSQLPWMTSWSLLVSQVLTLFPVMLHGNHLLTFGPILLQNCFPSTGVH